ncbi:heat shock protein DnaJ, partial [Calocera cornea HHB12733]
MADPAQEQDAYELLGVGPESTDEQIRKAYRQTSLRVHPDKNPSPEASALFHALTQAYALLQDPLQRAALNASL